MRKIGESVFLKIVDGKDYEFLINGYAFEMGECISISSCDIASPHNLLFKGCKFKSMALFEVQIGPSLTFQNCRFKDFIIDNCSLKQIEFENCTIERLVFTGNQNLGAVKINSSSIDYFDFNNNTSFQLLHIGCHNQLNSVQLINNGSKNEEVSRFFLCPERFNSIRIDKLHVASLEIGTFGEYSELTLTEVVADHILVRNCNSFKTSVIFEKVLPKNRKNSTLRLSNSNIDASVFDEGFIESYHSIEMENSTIESPALEPKD